MRIREYKQSGKAALKGNWGNAIGGLLVAGILASAVSATMIGTLIAPVFMVGLVIVYVNIYNSSADKGIGNLFAPFKSNWLAVIIGSLLKGIYLVLWSIITFGIMGIVKSYSYAMTEYLLATDTSLSGNEAITKSRQLMNGNKMKLFLLDLSFIGWMILVTITAGLAAFYVAPYAQMTRIAFFEEIAKGQVSASATEVKTEATVQA